MADDWRREADDDWLAAHRSTNFERLRRRVRMLGGLAEAMSNAELGPLAGAPRRPRLKIGGKTYAMVRYTTHHIAYTTIHVDPGLCRRCGQQLVEVHRIVYARGEDARTTVGTVRTCRRCQGDSWMSLSRMPSVTRARRVARKIVL
jgi:hypothetical protein